MGKKESFAALPASVLNAVQGRTVRYAAWPNMTGAALNTDGGALIVSGNGVWGALANIAALNDIAADFWICSLILNSFAPGAGKYDIEITGAVGAPVLAQTTVEITAATVNLPNVPFPFPIYMVANAVVQCRAGDAAGGGNIYVGILYATLL